MSACKYFGLGKTCKKNIGCRDLGCTQHPEYYREAARCEMWNMSEMIGKRVRAYKDKRKYMEGNRCVHGRLVKVFLKGNSVAYKVNDGLGNTVTCSFLEIAMFQDV